MKLFVIILMALSLASCSKTATSNGSGSVQNIPLDQQIAAATATANSNQYCIGANGNPPIAPFYWEIGSATSGNTPLASGSVPAPTPGPTPVGRTTVMDIASASKMIFGTYATQAIPNILNDKISTKFLQMAAGYNSFQDASCTAQNSGAKSILDCYDTCCELDPKGNTVNCAINLNTVQTAGDTIQCNSTYTPSQDGVFNYGGGHFERFGVHNAPNLPTPSGGADGDGAYGLPASFANLGGVLTSAPTDLASTIINYSFFNGNLPNLYSSLSSTFSYSFPDLAGGAHTNAADYATILQAILGGNLEMYSALGQNPICAWSKNPATAVANNVVLNCNSSGSPINYEALHYSYGHWIEDDPWNGDGAFSSPGKFGFYPWIDKTKTYYGIVSRYESGVGISESGAVGQGWNSLLCGRQIRKAFITGIQQ